MILVHNYVYWDPKALIFSWKHSNFSDFVYFQGGKTIREIW